METDLGELVVLVFHDQDVVLHLLDFPFRSDLLQLQLLPRSFFLLQLVLQVLWGHKNGEKVGTGPMATHGSCP